jgi:hypothetical protein
MMLLGIIIRVKHAMHVISNTKKFNGFHARSYFPLQPLVLPTPGVALPGVALPGVALPGVALPQLGLPSVVGVGGMAGIGTPGVVIPQLSRPPAAGKANRQMFECVMVEDLWKLKS